MSVACDLVCRLARVSACRSAARGHRPFANMAPHLRFLLASLDSACISARSLFGLAEPWIGPIPFRGGHFGRRGIRGWHDENVGREGWPPWRTAHPAPARCDAGQWLLSRRSECQAGDDERRPESRRAGPGSRAAPQGRPVRHGEPGRSKPGGRLPKPSPGLFRRRAVTRCQVSALDARDPGPRRSAGRARVPAAHRKRLPNAGRVARGGRRTLAIHSRDRPPLRPPDRRPRRRAARPHQVDRGRLRLSERSPRDVRRLGALTRGLQ